MLELRRKKHARQFPSPSTQPVDTALARLGIRSRSTDAIVLEMNAVVLPLVQKLKADEGVKRKRIVLSVVSFDRESERHRRMYEILVNNRNGLCEPFQASIVSNVMGVLNESVSWVEDCGELNCRFTASVKVGLQGRSERLRFVFVYLLTKKTVEIHTEVHRLSRSAWCFCLC